MPVAHAATSGCRATNLDIASVHKSFFPDNFKIVAFATALSLGSSPAIAANLEADRHLIPLDRKTTVIKFSDLNLSNSSDVQVLFQRVRTMASNLCGRQSDIRQLKAVYDKARCIERSYKEALVAINQRTGVETDTAASGTTTSRKVVGAE